MSLTRFAVATACLALCISCEPDWELSLVKATVVANPGGTQTVTAVVESTGQSDWPSADEILVTAYWAASPPVRREKLGPTDCLSQLPWGSPDNCVRAASTCLAGNDGAFLCASNPMLDIVTVIGSQQLLVGQRAQLLVTSKIALNTPESTPAALLVSLIKPPGGGNISSSAQLLVVTPP